MSSVTIVTFTGKCECGEFDVTTNATAETQNLSFLIRGAANKLIDHLISKRHMVVAAKCNRCGKLIGVSVEGEKRERYERQSLS